MKTTTILVHTYEPPPRYARGGLVKSADRVRRAGRLGDSYLLHLSKEELAWLKSQWGEPTINPVTGLPEYFKIGKIFKKVGKIFKKVAPIALPAMMVMFPGIGTAIGGALGMGTGMFASMAGNAILGAGVGALTGGKKGALYGGLGGAAAAGLSGIMGGGLSAVGGAGEVSAAPWVGGAAIDAAGPSSTAAAGLTESLGGAGLGGIGAGVGSGVGSGVAAAAPQTGGALAQVARMGSDVLGTATKNPMMSMMALSALGAGKPKQAQMPDSQAPKWFHGELPEYDYERPQASLANIDFRRYGYGPEQSFFDQNALPTEPKEEDEEEDLVATAAEGGLLQAFGLGGSPRSGGAEYVDGPGSGRDDRIPALLSDGEYVMDAETVALVGDGSSNEGARRLDQFRQNIRSHKGKALARGKFSPNARSLETYLPRGRS